MTRHLDALRSTLMRRYTSVIDSPRSIEIGRMVLNKEAILAVSVDKSSQPTLVAKMYGLGDSATNRLRASYDHAWQLHQSGFDVARVHRGDDGHIVQPLGMHPFGQVILMDYRPATAAQFQSRPSSGSAIGAALADIHGNTNTQPRQVDSSRPWELSSTLCPDPARTRCISRSGRGLAAMVDDEVARCLESVDLRTIEFCTSVGDPAIKNWAIAPEQCTLLDLDSINLRPRTWDIASFLAGLVLQDGISRAVDTAGAFLASYCKRQQPAEILSNAADFAEARVWAGLRANFVTQPNIERFSLAEIRERYGTQGRLARILVADVIGRLRPIVY